MNNDNDNMNIYNQSAWILNYKPNIGQQHIHFGNQPNNDEPKNPANQFSDFEEVEEKEEGSVTDVKQGEIKPAAVKPNYYAPKVNLLNFLKQEWFKKNRTKDEYDEQWIDAFVKALMETEWKDSIARDWAVKGKRNKVTQIKGYIVGLLVDNDVLKGNYDSIAAEIEGLRVKPRTFSRYMGEGSSQPYADWVKYYISNN